MIPALQFFVSYLIVDVLCMALTVIISANVSRNSGSERQVRYFFFVLTAFLVFVAFDAVWAFIAYSQLVSASAILLSVVNGINLTAIAFAAYFWLGFILARFESRATNSRWTRFLTALPALMVPVIHLVGFFSGQNVTVLPDGNMAYGICHTVIVCIQLLYILAATVFAMSRYRNAATRADRNICLVFMSFMIPFVIGGVVDVLVAGTPVAAASIVVSLVFVMISMQESRISSDALTGLNNRRRADAFLEESIAHASTKRPLCLLIIDLNKFKQINDTYGHLEGDKALRLTADALRNACTQVNAFGARWGGDEFVIICTSAFAGNPDDIAALVKDALANVVSSAGLKYDLTCSIGYSICDSPARNKNNVIACADEMLYEVKNNLGVQRQDRET